MGDERNNKPPDRPFVVKRRGNRYALLDPTGHAWHSAWYGFSLHKWRDELMRAYKDGWRAAMRQIAKQRAEQQKTDEAMSVAGALPASEQGIVVERVKGDGVTGNRAGVCGT